MTGFNLMYFLCFCHVQWYSIHVYTFAGHNGYFCVSCLVPVGMYSRVLGASESGPFCNAYIFFFVYTHTSQFLWDVLHGHEFCGSYVIVGCLCEVGCLMLICDF